MGMLLLAGFFRRAYRQADEGSEYSAEYCSRPGAGGKTSGAAGTLAEETDQATEGGPGKKADNRNENLASLIHHESDNTIVKGRENMTFIR